MSAWPSLRPILPALLALSLSHCSCQRQPDGPPPPDPGVSALARLPVATDDNPVPAAATDPAAADRSSIGAGAAVATLHAYLGALPGNDRTRADAYWSGSGPGKPADDSVLRQLPELRAMRIESGRPLPLDQEQPARAWRYRCNCAWTLQAGRSACTAGTGCAPESTASAGKSPRHNWIR